MSANVSDKLHRINYLTSELDALYHQASLLLGLNVYKNRAKNRNTKNGLQFIK